MSCILDPLNSYSKFIAHYRIRLIRGDIGCAHVLDFYIARYCRTRLENNRALAS